MATDQLPSEENERIARRVPEDIATEGDFDLIDEVFAEDAVERNPWAVVRGREEIHESFDDLADSFGDFSATVEETVTEGDTVAMRVTLRGTHEGEFMGFPPTGKSFEVGNMVFTRIEGGMIVERWVQPDAPATRTRHHRGGRRKTVRLVADRNRSVKCRSPAPPRALRSRRG